MKILYILPTLLLFSFFVSAQNEEDALRFSRQTPFGLQELPQWEEHSVH